MKTLAQSIFCSILVIWLTAFPAQAEETMLPAVNASVTFLYYKDLGPAEEFYGTVLGFQKEFDRGWVKIFRITDGGRVGLVDEAKGSLKTAMDKPVMLSIDTPEVKKWYQHVKAKGAKYIKTHLNPERNAFANTFMLTDPGGYHVQFFQWNKETEQN